VVAVLAGRDALRRIDSTLRRARGDLDRVGDELQATSRAVTANKLAQARAINRMARVRLDAAQRGEVVAHLEAATREAGAILDERDAQIRDIADRVSAAAAALEELEQRRDTLHDDVDAAAVTLAGREAAVQQRLEADEAFVAQLDKTHEADAIATRAKEKAALAAEDSRAKGEPFESDSLFMYLWNRGYGTSAYRANPLARLLDGWVARRCRYADNRPNYWMLLEIPKRLAEHAAHAREAADEQVAALRAIEEQAARDGAVPDARDALAALEERQDGIDAEIESAEQGLAELRAEQNRYTAGADDLLLDALRVFAAAMERRDISELMQLARATVTDEDDAIVEELRALRREYDELEEELREHTELQSERLARIHELEEVRRSFKRSRYDDIHSRFERGDTIERMIGEVVSGVIQGSALWKILRRYQRYADTAGEWPDFGSGGIVIPSRRNPRQSGKRHSGKRSTPWHWPGSGSQTGGAFKIPRSGGRSRRRGGFKTGGGF
jgi:chromosome segregation ATPase